MAIISEETSILLPHPEHIFANYFFFSPRTSNIYLFEDGLMNYLDIRLTGNLLKRSKRRRLLSYSLFYKYRIIRGYLSGCEDRAITATFVRFPDLIYMPEKHGSLHTIYSNLKNDFTTYPDHALFIDQDIESQYGSDEALRLRMKLYSKLSTFTKVYIKLHHDYLSVGFTIRNTASNFEILPTEMQRMPAEQLIEKLKPGSVWGFYSSALVNIANDHRDIICYSCIPEQHSVKTAFGFTPLSNLMRRFGVRSV